MSNFINSYNHSCSRQHFDFFFFIFHVKLMSHIKCQVLFSVKNDSKNSECLLQFCLAPRRQQIVDIFVIFPKILPGVTAKCY